jgi:hypothetical protein
MVLLASQFQQISIKTSTSKVNKLGLYLKKINANNKSVTYNTHPIQPT